MRDAMRIGSGTGSGMWGKAGLVGVAALWLVGCTGAQQQGRGGTQMQASGAQAGGSQASRNQTGGTQAGGMQTRMLEDPRWGVPAATVTMPVGWKFDGVAEHGESCVMSLPDTRWAASSADGVTRIQYYPQITYNYSPNPADVQRGAQQGCLVTPYWKPEDFLAKVIAPSLRPGVTPQVNVAMTGDMPMLKQKQAQEAQFDEQSRGTRHSQVGFATMALEYKAGGTPMVETFLGMFTCVSSQFSGGPPAIQCQIDQGMSFTGPENTLMAVIQKQPVQVKWTDAWVARMRQMLEQRNAASQAQTNAIIAGNTRRQNDLHASLMAQGQAQYDAGVARNKAQTDGMHQSMVATANHMGDVNDYRDPSTGNTYKVSNQYSHTYVDNTGRTVVQTNSAYAPGPDTVWQEMVPR